MNEIVSASDGNDWALQTRNLSDDYEGDADLCTEQNKYKTRIRDETVIVRTSSREK